MGVGILIFLFVDLREFGGVLLRTGRVPERIGGKNAGSRDLGEKCALLRKGLVDGCVQGSVIRVDAFRRHAEVPDDEQVDCFRNIFHFDA